MSGDGGYNEIAIAVTAVNTDAKAVFDQTAAAGAELARKPIEIPVTASDPINDAWRAKVNAEIRSAARDALNIPVNAQTEGLRGEVASALADAREFARLEIPAELADATTFRASVEALVESVRADVAAGIQVPVTVEAPAGRLPASEVPDLTEREPTGSPAAFRTGVETVPLAEIQGVYADATAKIAGMEPIGVKTTATNPIDAAFVAQVRGSVRSIANEALDIPVTADTVPFVEQVQAVLEQLSTTSQADVPLEVGDAMAFREQVAQLVQQVSNSVHAVIGVQVDESGLSDLQTKTLAAAQATTELAGAEQKLNEAYASGDQDKVDQARADVMTATRAEAQATEELTAAQNAAGVAAVGLAEAEDTAAVAGRGLSAAMGPLWMVMNVAQLAMFAFMGTSSSGASTVQNLTSQIVSLGNATGSSASGMLAGNDALSKINTQLVSVGSSSAAFAQAAEGVDTFAAYTNQLEQAQSKLGSTMVTVTQQTEVGGRAAQEEVSSTKTLTESIADLASQQSNGALVGTTVSASVQHQIDLYNDYVAVVPAAKQELAQLQAQQQLENAQLSAVGITLSSTAQATNSYGLALQQLVKDYNDATAGARYLEDSQDKASIAAGQGIQQWQQLQASVTSAGQASTQAGESVQSAIHSEQQAVIAATASQTAYTNAVYQEGQAEQAVTAARAAAQQQLVSLTLASNDANASALSANLSLFQAQQNAAKVGVNSGNEEAIASGPITTSNEPQVAAADALIAAENQVADSQNNSAVAQSNLNTARQQGVDNNSAVLAAEHALQQAKDGVTTAIQGETNAQWAQLQAEQAVTQAKEAATAAYTAYTTAEANATRSTDANTLAGAQNRQSIENIYDAYIALYGPGQQAADMTENVGEKMGFTGTQVYDVIDRLNGLNGMNAQFGITGTPSLNTSALEMVGQQIGIAFNSVGTVVSNILAANRAAGGPGGGLTWVGEHGRELVQLAPGSNVIPNANAEALVASGQVSPPGRAAGGPVGAPPSAQDAVAANIALAGQWGVLDAMTQGLYALGGGPQLQLPAPGPVDLGSFGSFSAPGGGAVSGNAASNKAVMQQVFAGFGWGSGPEWAAQNYVEMREAGYNNLAQNPTSSAFGMGQFLDSTWASYGFSKTIDPQIQSIAMATYERDRYHDPIGAAAHERAYNWYATGGPAGGLVGVNDGPGPEVINLPNGSQVVPAANAAAALGNRVTQVELTVNITGDGGMASWFKQAVRTGGIQLSANGARVTVSA